MPLPYPLNFAIARANNDAAGFYFFSPDTMRFFRSRLCGRMYGRFFVTSERGPYAVRRYTVRRSDPDGAVSTFSTFQQHTTRDSAIRAAKRAYRRDPS